MAYSICFFGCKLIEQLLNAQSLYKNKALNHIFSNFSPLFRSTSLNVSVLVVVKCVTVVAFNVVVHWWFTTRTK